jgi:hypothetical protein
MATIQRAMNLSIVMSILVVGNVIGGDEEEVVGRKGQVVGCDAVLILI